MLADFDRDLLRECSQPKWAAPMLATLTDERFSKEDWILERKTSPFSGEHASGSEITWVTPELVGEFGFTEWTSAGKLRHPRFLGLRRDKDPRKVVRESPGGTS
jgi:ATP-dependent DNA ligase